MDTNQKTLEITITVPIAEKIHKDTIDKQDCIAIIQYLEHQDLLEISNVTFKKSQLEVSKFNMYASVITDLDQDLSDKYTIEHTTLLTTEAYTIYDNARKEREHKIEKLKVVCNLTEKQAMRVLDTLDL